MRRSVIDAKIMWRQKRLKRGIATLMEFSDKIWKEVDVKLLDLSKSLLQLVGRARKTMKLKCYIIYNIFTSIVVILLL